MNPCWLQADQDHLVEDDKMIRLAKWNSAVLLGIVFGLLFWLLETAIHAYIFHHGSFIQELFPTLDIHEIWMRLIVIGILFVFGVYSQSAISNRKQVEETLQKAHDKLDLRVKERTTQLVKANEQLLREVAKRKLAEEALQESERSLRATIEASPLPIIAINPEARVTLWNPAADRVFGWSEQEVLGKPYPIVPTGKGDEHRLLRKRAFAGETFTGVELVRQTRDGALIDVSVSTAPVFDAKGNVKSVMAVLEDITKRKQAEKAFSWESSVNAALADLSSALILSKPIEDISWTVLELAKSHTGSPFGFAGFIDPDTGHLVSVTMTRDVWDKCNVPEKEIVFKRFAGLWGWVLDNREPLLTNNPARDHRSMGTPEGHIPITRFLSVPAIIGESLVGQIALANSERDYDERDLTFLQRLAPLYAIAIQRKQAEEALQEANDQLEFRVKERASELVRSNEQLLREITERKLAEEALKESEEKFRLVTETIQDVFWLSTPGIGEMIYVSPGYEKIWGRTKESLYESPTSFLEAIHTEDRERVFSGVGGHGEGVWDFEYRIVQPDGSVRWIRDRGFPVRDEEGNLYRMTGVATDISESKLAEERILKTTQMLQSVFDGISDPLLMLDEKLSVKMVNQAAAKYYQITDSQAIVDKPCYEAFRGRASPCDGCIVPERVENGGTDLFERNGLFDPDRLEQVTIYPVREVPGGLTGCILRISDITEQKKLDKQLRRADRLSSLGQLSGGIAHEIRNPLSGISLFVDILADEEQFQRTDKELEVLGEIKGNINKIDGIIKRILSFARESATAVSEVDLNSLIQENLKLWYARMRKAKIKLQLSLDDNLPAISGDAIGIQQVVNNLIQNAVEAMDGGGSLQISLKNGMSKFYEDRPVVIMSVQDTGPGINQNLLEKIFDPFFTTKSSGIGLGLSISHQIIEHHGGFISCDSNAEQGTAFSFELPVVPKG